MKTKGYTIESMDALYPEANAKLRELTNKTLSEWVMTRNNNIDCFIAAFLAENKCNPKDVVIVERKTEFGAEFSVKHKNTPMSTHLKL